MSRKLETRDHCDVLEINRNIREMESKMIKRKLTGNRMNQKVLTKNQCLGAHSENLIKELLGHHSIFGKWHL